MVSKVVCRALIHHFQYIVLAMNFLGVSYNFAGSKPFADFATSLSLDPFIQHLKEGNRLSQPEGLSKSV